MHESQLTFGGCMQVVLTQTVDKLGIVGDTKEVKRGFARNFLFPRKLAVLPGDPKAKILRKQRRAIAETLSSQKTLIQELATQWRNQEVTIRARSSEDGTLYGSVGRKEILKALGRDDIDLDVPNLKKIGSHRIEARFIDGVSIPLTIHIESETRSATDRAKK